MTALRCPTQSPRPPAAPLISSADLLLRSTERAVLWCPRATRNNPPLRVLYRRLSGMSDRPCSLSGVRRRASRGLARSGATHHVDLADGTYRRPRCAGGHSTRACSRGSCPPPTASRVRAAGAVVRPRPRRSVVGVSTGRSSDGSPRATHPRSRGSMQTASSATCPTVGSHPGEWRAARYGSRAISPRE